MASEKTKKTAEKLESPEQLDKLIVVTPPMTWMVITGAVIMIAAFLIWSIFGTISRYEDVKGVATESEIIAFVPVDYTSGLKENDRCSYAMSTGEATGERSDGIIIKIDDKPVTQEEAISIAKNEAVGEWLTDNKPMVAVHILPSENKQTVSGEIADVQVVVSEDRPYQLVF